MATFRLQFRAILPPIPAHLNPSIKPETKYLTNHPANPIDLLARQKWKQSTFITMELVGSQNETAGRILKQTSGCFSADSVADCSVELSCRCPRFILLFVLFQAPFGPYTLYICLFCLALRPRLYSTFAHTYIRTMTLVNW